MAVIPKGYKQTEVGVIPDEWKATTIGNVCSFSGGSQPPRYTFKFAPSNGYIRLIQIRDYKSDAFETYIPGSLAQKRCTANDIMIGRYGPPVFQILRGIEGAYNVALIKTVPTEKIDREYLFYVLKQEKLFQMIDALSRRSSGQTGVEMPALKEYCLPLPPLPEQRAIAAALSDVDALLAKLDQLIAKKHNLKQAAMQQLLTGQTRLPGFSGAWEVKRLGALGSTYGGLAGKTKEDFGRGDARYIPFMNVMTDTVIDADWLEQVDVAPDEAQNTAKNGDLFFNGSSETPEEVGFCSVLLEDIPNLYLNSFCFGFRLNAEARGSGLFFAYWFRCQEGRKAMSVLAQGATRYNIAKSAFLRLEIPQPSVEEQTAIATVLSDMDAELAALEARRDKTRALKQGMMQKLLTGRIRLVEEG
ncbi:MAG: restriction endonuclease subunit S [Azonexus sp.]|jgi:type I restriction enzyme S subunit|nr:restriction endonuclease subunit S [Azonexus sp.]